MSTGVERALAMFASMVDVPDPTIDDKRRGYQRLLDSLPVIEGAEVCRRSIGGVPCVVVTAPGATGPDTVLMLHGGGYVMGSAWGYRGFASAVSAAVGVPVVAVDYRLAPEHPYPAALDDARAVHRALAATGPVAVVGDSGGGGLALGLLMALRDEGAPAPVCAVAISPEVDLTASSDSLVRNRDRDPLVRRESILLHGGMYLAGRDPRRTPYASPLQGDHGGLPPVLVLTGDAEGMHDEAVAIAGSMRAAGTDATLEIAPGMFHVWPLFWSLLAEGRQAVDRIGGFVAGHLATAS